MSTLGSNLAHAQKETGLDSWCYGGQRMKEELKKFNQSEVPIGDEWRLPMLEKLLSQRLLAFYEDSNEINMIDSQIQSLVTN